MKRKMEEKGSTQCLKDSVDVVRDCEEISDALSNLMEKVNTKRLRISNPGTEFVFALENIKREGRDNKAEVLKRAYAFVFLNPETTSNIFGKENSEIYSELDFDYVDQFYSAVVKVDNEEIVCSLLHSMEELIKDIKSSYLTTSLGDEHAMKIIRPFLVILMNPFLLEPENHGLLNELCLGIKEFLPGIKILFVMELNKFPEKYFLSLIETLQHFITISYLSTNFANEMTQAAVESLALLVESNEAVKRVPRSAFYNDVVNAEDFDRKKDYAEWKKPGNLFSFCRFPFLYDPASKSSILRFESRRERLRNAEDAVYRAIFSGRGGEVLSFTLISVRRDHVIQDAIQQIISKSEEDLKKQLKVKFVGEPGVDEGGVQKEFFQLIVKEIFSKQYGLFWEREEMRQFWFNSSIEEAEREYELIGMVIGLAIYNGHILEFRLPAVIFKKLLEKSTDLEDLVEVDPALAKGLKDLLELEGDVENTLMCSFEMALTDAFGDVHTVELKEGGAEIPVTAQNRGEYVDLCVDFFLNKSIAKQFGPFKKGFDKICGSTSLFQLFQPEELELLVCGNPVFDFEALEKTASYEDGYTQNSETIRDFWKIVHEFSVEEKKKLLRFTTGSDKVPIKGLGDLPFVISRNGPDSDRLPTAHVCFNHLLLPQYSSIEKLKDRLSLAISNAEGFGLR